MLSSALSRAVLGLNLALAVLAATNGKVGPCVGYGTFALVLALVTEPRTRRLVRLKPDLTSPDAVAMSMALVAAIASVAALAHLTAVLRGQDSSVAHVIDSLMLAIAGPYLAVVIPWQLRKRQRAGDAAQSSEPDSSNTDGQAVKRRAAERNSPGRRLPQVSNWSDAERRRQLTVLLPVMLGLVFVLVFAAVLISQA